MDSLNSFINNFFNFGKLNNYDITQRSPLVSPFFKDEFNLSAGHQVLMPTILSNESQPIRRIIVNEPCLRRIDFEKLGVSNIHLLLFEMGVFGIFGERKNENENRYSILSDCFNFLSSLNLNRNNIFFSVSNGAEIQNHKFDPDNKSCLILKEIGVSAKNIIQTFGRQNFIFSKGDNRPSGYSIEIFYNYENQFVEIGSINIYEYIFVNKEFVKNTANFGIGCGFGFERLQFILQKQRSVYDLDLFCDTINKIKEKFNPVNFLIIKERLIKIIELLKTLLFIHFDGQMPDKSPHGKIMKIFLSKLISEVNYLSIGRNDIGVIINNIYFNYSGRYNFNTFIKQNFESLIYKEIYG
jgi:alanyl-tRNA synthetase